MAQLLASSIVTWIWIGTLCLTVTAPLIAEATSFGFEPEFTEAMVNVTVATGRDAILSCSVTHLGGHKVGWVKADTKAIQAIHTTVVTHNPRVSVEHVGSSQWKLIIKSVRKEDAGFYMAQINTDPMKSQVTYLDVTESPDIIDERTPGELRVRENEALKLTCEARGNPAPRITWKREDGRDLHLSPRDDPKGFLGTVVRNKSHPSIYNVIEGETLRISHVSKLHMGVYFCIANNGVPPPVSKRVAVTVLFAPTVTVDNQIVSVPFGNNVTLECIVESSPKSINVWYKKEMMIANSSRLSYDEKVETSYRVRMILNIRHFHQSDVGTYECRCRNEHGEAASFIGLHELKMATTTTTTTSTLAPPPLVWFGENEISPQTTLWTRNSQRERVLTTVRPRHHFENPTRSMLEYLPTGEPSNHEQIKATLRPPRHGYSSAGSSLSTLILLVQLLLIVTLAVFS